MDLGITGKDVLMEQHERVVYELLDLGYGRCRMVVATRAGDRFADDLERRLGAIRIATKYPRVAARYFEAERAPGRGDRGEGVGRAGAALRPGGRASSTSRRPGARCEENDLEVREVIADCTRPPGREPGRAQDAPRGDRRARGADRRRCALGRVHSSRASPARAPRARGPAPPTSASAVAEILDDVRARGDEAVRELTGGSTAEAAADARDAGADSSSARIGLDPEVRVGLEARDRERAARGGGGALGRRSRSSCPRARRSTLRELPVARAGVYVPGGRAAYPSSVRDVLRARARCRRGGDGRGDATGHDGTERAILAACALCGVEEVHLMGGAQAIAALAYGTESVARRGRDRRPRQRLRAGGQAPGRGTVGIDGIAGPDRAARGRGRGGRPASCRARPRRAGRARRRDAAGARQPRARRCSTRSRRRPGGSRS